MIGLEALFVAVPSAALGGLLAFFWCERALNRAHDAQFQASRLAAEHAADVAAAVEDIRLEFSKLGLLPGGVSRPVYWTVDIDKMRDIDDAITLAQIAASRPVKGTGA